VDRYRLLEQPTQGDVELCDFALLDGQLQLLPHGDWVVDEFVCDTQSYPTLVGIEDEPQQVHAGNVYQGRELL
jgi:hypothetical protein